MYGKDAIMPDGKRLDWDGFMRMPFVSERAGLSRWSISDKDKRPIDMVRLLSTGRVHGAWSPDERCLVPLTTIADQIPNASCIAYHLDVEIDHMVCIDIEKTCPDELKRSLLDVRHEYAESSRSGTGVHLLVREPKNLHDFPDAAVKAKLQAKDRSFEILMCQYVTFTTRMLDIPDGTQPIEPVYEGLASLAHPSVASSIALEGRPDDIPREADLLHVLEHVSYGKEPSDYGNDMSRYEFGYMAKLAAKLLSLRKVYPFSRESYEDSTLVWVLYDSASDLLEHREKHATSRLGMPYLLYQSIRVLETVLSEPKDKKGRGR